MLEILTSIISIIFVAYTLHKYREKIFTLPLKSLFAIAGLFASIIAGAAFLIYYVGNWLVGMIPWSPLRLPVFIVIVIAVIYPAKWLLWSNVFRVLHVDAERE
ncbi:hypothetical protein KP77_27870 [Jeotgalibacillus alimentarius]|uniref:Uncharacterized protein n=1 Tax=Jeotgalibacillus alimentarius TaxID=135826 RepID=A0A0C2R8R6_9BACL|nr:hypothetical protein [Jeotgalibacillus alimentarius]KIL46660.1 hypothetical protein KP77_27870 [Jeotgalibacillus alimentarius]